MTDIEATATFPCFGSICTVNVLGDAPAVTAEAAVASAREHLLEWHERFTRFEPGSELSRLNADPAPSVRVSTVMALFAEAVIAAAETTGGLVDATLLGAIEEAGYRTDLRASVPLGLALPAAPPRAPAAPSRASRWREISVDRESHTVTRPPGVRLDSGGLAKGLFADLLGQELAPHRSFAVDCAGDLLLGGDVERELRVGSPFGDDVLHVFRVAATGVATSGIGRRSWLDEHGRPAHHLLDPATGRPAFTGVVQVTALAPTGLLAEVRSKAALLSGPEGAAAWLPDGGVVVCDDGSHHVIEPPTRRDP